jgi:REP element-mobilizing transposase RayT
MPPKTFITPMANVRSRGYLPHWEAPDAIYHVIFRLNDSLPRHVAEQLAREREALGKIVFAQRFDEALDHGYGCGALKDPKIAEVIVTALHYWDGDRYELFSWCVMPNHVHVAVRMHDSLANVLHSWKTYTARLANAIRGSTGRFWCREYYDHIVRNDEELRNLSRYIMNNPDKARLFDWPWRGTKI